MITVTVKGVNDAIGRLREISDNIGNYATEGTNLAGHFLAARIQAKTFPGYGKSVVVETDYSAKRTVVGPSISYAPLKELGSRAKFIKYGCPWWKYLAVKLRGRVPSDPMLHTIVAESLDEIKNIIIGNIIKRIR